MIRGFVIALVFSGGALVASPEIAFADGYVGHWLRVITAEGKSLIQRTMKAVRLSCDQTSTIPTRVQRQI